MWLIKILGLFFVLAWRHGMFQSRCSVKSLELRVWFDVGVFQRTAVHESSSVAGLCQEHPTAYAEVVREGDRIWIHVFLNYVKQGVFQPDVQTAQCELRAR